MLTWASPVVSANKAHVVVFPVPGVPVTSILGFDRCIYLSIEPEIDDQQLLVLLSRSLNWRRAVLCTDVLDTIIVTKSYEITLVVPASVKYIAYIMMQRMQQLQLRSLPPPLLVGLASGHCP